MPLSLFTRLAVAEAELRAMKDMLADVLDILAEVKANQDEMRRDHDAGGGKALRPATNQRLPGWRRSKIDNFLRRAVIRIRYNFTLIKALLKEDELTFWKGMGRTAIIGLFLITVFIVCLYQLRKQN